MPSRMNIVLKRIAVVTACGVLLLLILFIHLSVYLHLVNVTGYHEWCDLVDVQNLRTSSGRPLHAVVEARLRSAGWTERVEWNAGCFGSTTTVTASVDADVASTCIAFDYDHRGTLKSGNTVARELFPNLEWRGGAYGWPACDNASLQRPQKRGT